MNGLTSEQLDELRQILEDQRNRLLRNARRSISDQISGGDGLPADTIDVSTDESSKVTELRLRDREKYLIAKIEKTLKRMDEGSYGECHDCGAEIGFARLKARPVAELCIDCKEEQCGPGQPVPTPAPVASESGKFKKANQFAKS